MKTKLGFVLSALGASVLLSVACGGETSNTATGNASGAAGQSGSGGSTAGTSGTGQGGSGAQAGSGGSAASSGSSGSGGSGGAGNAGNGGSGGVGAVGGSGGSGGSIGAIEGSYDFHFTQAVVESTFWDSVSPGVSFRLDIRAKANSNTEYEAVLTGAFADPGGFSGVLSSNSLVLDGAASFDAPGGYGDVTDSWTHLELTVNNGSLTGQFVANGHSDTFGGDVGDSSDLSGQGTIAQDTTVPQIKASVRSSHAPDGQFLPWDPIVVSASEGMTLDTLTPALSATGVTGGQEGGIVPVDVTWSYFPDDMALSWAGTTVATGVLTNWDPNGVYDLTISVSGTAEDRSGHMVAQLNTDSTGMLWAGYPQLQHDFDSDVINAALWGDYMLFGGLVGSDPFCETGGCVSLGPFVDTDCGAITKTGIAGRLTVQEGDLVQARYRLFAEDQSGPQTPPQLYFYSFMIEITNHQGQRVYGYPDVFSLTWSPTNEPINMPLPAWESPWTTTTVELPAGFAPEGEVGFVVYVGDSGCGGPLPPSATQLLQIDSIFTTPTNLPSLTVRSCVGGHVYVKSQNAFCHNCACLCRGVFQPSSRVRQ